MQSPPTVDLAAVGDIMLGRFVGKRLEREPRVSLFGPLKQELERADIAFGNLEAPFTTAPFTGRRRIHLRANPRFADRLRMFDVLSVANNHAMDAGSAGLDQTLQTLQRQGIRSVGTSGAPLIIEKKGVRIAFLAFSDFPKTSGNRIADSAHDWTSSICDARAKADIVVVSWHWGEEGTANVSGHVRNLTFQAAHAGADVILGHHPHVFQSIGFLRRPDGGRCLVANSLGNFVFDARTPQERRTGILHVRLSRSGVLDYRVTPAVIERGYPRPVEISASLRRSEALPRAGASLPRRRS